MTHQIKKNLHQTNFLHQINQATPTNLLFYEPD